MGKKHVKRVVSGHANFASSCLRVSRGSAHRKCGAASSFLVSVSRVGRALGPRSCSVHPASPIGLNGT
jgi:hypothetical protein